MTPGRRIVVISDSTGWGGAEISLTHLLRRLPASVHITLLCVDPAIAQRLAGARPGTALALLPHIRKGREIAGLRRWRRALRDARPDVVHANLTWGSSCLWPLVVATIGRPPVVVVENAPTPVESAWERWVKRRAASRWSAHVAVSEGAAREVEVYGGWPRGAVGVVHNGVPDLGRLPLRTPDGAVVLGTLARLTRLKGLDLLLRALAELPGCRLLIAGDGEDKHALEEQAAELGVHDRVELRGWVPDARSLLAEIDIFVLPSRAEGFPLSILEALIAERPVVATDVGGVREAVLDGRTGLLVQPEDPAALALALRRLVADPDLRARLASAGRAHAAESFSDLAMATRLAAVYDILLSPGMSRSARRRAARSVTAASAVAAP